MPRTPIFLFTDIEGSTRLWEAEPAQMSAVVARHDALCHEVVDKRAGRVVKTMGDGLYAAFDDPFDALSAAIELQRGIQSLARECDLALKMRCGLHAGAAKSRDGDYFGPAVNCAVRVMDAAHGGQVLGSVRAPPIRLRIDPAHLWDDGPALLRTATELGLEAVDGKRLDSPYVAVTP